MKYKIGIVVILAAYFAFSVATTKKEVLPPCFMESDLEVYLVNSSPQKYQYMTYFKDTLLFTYIDTAGVQINDITDSVCRMGLQKCGLQKLTILIRDTTNAPRPYGKVLFTKDCR